MGIGLCPHEGNVCIHKDTCGRYLQPITDNASFYDFPKICNEKTKYKWLWQTVTAVVKVEEEK